jgi:DNA-directed RNA polymerase specialized sigma24 family protein
LIFKHLRLSTPSNPPSRASIEVAGPGDDDQRLAVNEALDKLSAIHAVQAEVVKLRCFVGMTNVEVAQALGLPERTAKYYWTHARA